MTFDEFKNSVGESKAPDVIHPLLEALRQDAKGNWSAAHNLAQEIETKDGAWVHAYLHRKEGDASNAIYWYSLAGKKSPSISLTEEWEEIVNYLLAR